MKEINALTLGKLEDELLLLGEKKFRARQIFNWLHEKMVSDFDAMTNLSKNLREKLKEHFWISHLEIVQELKSQKDDTIKYLFKLHDDQLVESVLMKYKHGYSVCISSQVGCRMGCSFCASTLAGLIRNLSCGEMLDQIYEIQRRNQIKVKNIVIMGSGEPLENYDNLLMFLENINSKEGQNVSLRNITLSTCGLVHQIERLGAEKLQITLAVSLHAPFDHIREKLMPINRKYTIKELIQACDHYAKMTNRRITYEYALIKGVNDSDQCAHKLTALLKNKLSHVNLIPVNDVAERDYIKSTEKRIKEFADILEAGGVNVTIRRELGSDINAACGQLRNRYTSS